jgi:hypothetical protein
LNAISIDPFSKETILYLILAWTNVERPVGGVLFMLYYKLNKILQVNEAN